MITRGELIDATNFDWGITDTGEFWWREDEHDLEVRVAVNKEGKRVTGITVRHKDNDWGIELGEDWKKWILTAVHYSQFCDETFTSNCNPEHFWAMAKAIYKFGTEPMFGATEDGIYAHVGKEMFFMVYEDGRYDLFDSGIHAFAGSENGVLDAYNKLQEEAKLYSKFVEN
jgi:hypothetical protein